MRLAAAVVGDIHAWHMRPVCRGETDWYGVMKNYFDQLTTIVNSHKKHKDETIPIICCGDVFDRWNAPPELLNFMLRHMPQMVSVAGQHDLPYHRISDIGRSAYWTLVMANKLTHLHEKVPTPLNDWVTAYGTSWGGEIHRPRQPLTGFNVAVIHAYCWRKGKEYYGALPVSHQNKWFRQLKGYKIACFGDNHSEFITEGERTTIYNCGTFIRRKTSEAKCRPGVGLIWSDGTITRERFLTKDDKILTADEVIKGIDTVAGGFVDFIEDLRALSASTFDFNDIVAELMERRKVRTEVREMVLRALEKKKS